MAKAASLCRYLTGQNKEKSGIMKLAKVLCSFPRFYSRSITKLEVEEIIYVTKPLSTSLHLRQ